MIGRSLTPACPSLSLPLVTEWLGAKVALATIFASPLRSHIVISDGAYVCLPHFVIKEHAIINENSQWQACAGVRICAAV